jgi:pimeloyl-ACP methyl ester carboxylesterase
VSTGSDVSEFASSIVAPVLLIAADQDDITPLDAQRRVRSLFPTAELHIIPGVGHLVHYEKPIETAEIIRTFLASN